MLKSLVGLYRSLRSLETRLERIQLAIGRIEARQLRGAPLDDSEFSAFSQWGEDGVLQALMARVPLGERSFVEFGVESYREANTRFLLMHDYWRGLVLDGSAAHIAAIHGDEVAWRYGVEAVQAFVTRENINALLEQHRMRGDIGLLSIDIDGNDYWVWQAIEAISPRIVVVEYNGLFGATATVTVPYQADFTRTDAHYSNLYYGASIAALARLGADKGYALVAGNRAGNNAFFVRRDVQGELPTLTPAAAYRRARFRESRGRDGGLTFLDHAAARALIGSLPLVDVADGRARTVGELAT